MGSFTRAAEEFCVSQSVISRSVQRLEDQVGTCLIERTTRSVILTSAGEALLSDGALILDRLAVAANNARQIGHGVLAEIRVGVCPTTETWELICGIVNFREAWPDLKITIHAMMSDQQPEALRSSLIDIGIMQSPDLGRGELEWQVLSQYGLVAAVPGSWGFSPDKTIQLAQLRDRPWLMPGTRIAGAIHNAFMDQCRSAGFEPNVVGVADDPVSARIMIACGMGAAFFHDKGWSDPRGAISLLQFDDPQTVPPAQTIVAWSTASQAPQIRDLVRHLVQASERMPPTMSSVYSPSSAQKAMAGIPG